MNQRKTKVIVTLGPATADERALRRIKEKGVDFVRINMSHSSIADLERAVRMAKEVGVPFIIDTEGSQVRTGDLEESTIYFKENTNVIVWNKPVTGNRNQLCLRPGSVLGQLDEGDLIHIDFDTLILRVSDTTSLSEGYITTKVITGGFVGENKAVVIDPVMQKKIDLPALSEKDFHSIEVGLRENVEYIAVSFVRSGAAVDEARRATKNAMRIVSKIECIDALENIDEIIQKSDFLLIDRGDLSKEIPIERIPFTQKIIIEKARRQNTEVFVATNLLETMVEQRKPTRAEVQDVINTLLDGAAGLTLASETAIGKHAMECINMLNRLISHAESVVAPGKTRHTVHPLVKDLEASNYLLDLKATSTLVAPHGGNLVNRFLREPYDHSYLKSLNRVVLDQKSQMEVEQLATGTYSPLEGFMTKIDFHCVLSDMRLSDGTVWPIPIVLDVSKEVAETLCVGEQVALVDSEGDVVALLHLEEKYSFDKGKAAIQLYGTDSDQHPGVQMMMAMNPILLAGKLDLVKRRSSVTKEYELSPKQVRRLFEERGWTHVLGFHTRNVIHRAHEFIQRSAIESEHCDGLFVHPVVGGKKPGDFATKYIVQSYVTMLENFYPSDKVVLAAFSTFSRYAGPREALFTALCRKNFGCSHFIVGRDHTGVSNYYDPDASHKVFDQFPDIGIKVVKFEEVFYSKSAKDYVHKTGDSYREEDRLAISGSTARQMFERKEAPPSWFMRPEISEMILQAINNGEQVFVDMD